MTFRWRIAVPAPGAGCSSGSTRSVAPAVARPLRAPAQHRPAPGRAGTGPRDPLPAERSRDQPLRASRAGIRSSPRCPAATPRCRSSGRTGHLYAHLGSGRHRHPDHRRGGLDPVPDSGCCQPGRDARQRAGCPLDRDPPPTRAGCSRPDGRAALADRRSGPGSAAAAVPGAPAGRASPRDDAGPTPPPRPARVSAFEATETALSASRAESMVTRLRRAATPRRPDPECRRGRHPVRSADDPPCDRQ